MTPKKQRAQLDQITALVGAAKIVAREARTKTKHVSARGSILLRIAAEKLDHDARSAMTPRAYAKFSRRRDAIVAGWRESADDSVHMRAVGGAIVAAALASPGFEPE